MELQPDLLSVILRLHSTEGPALPFLSQALFSLAQSSYRPVEVMVVTQNFLTPQTKEVEEVVGRFPMDDGHQIQVVNFTRAGKKDHRSALLNAGMDAAKGRYLAFLDYDDYVFENAHATLIRQLGRSEAAAAFGGCMMAQATATELGWKTIRKAPVWAEKSEDEFLQGNIFPIHSFVVDRSRLKGGTPRFNENSSYMEDYEFLLQLRLQTRFDLTCQKQMLVEYVIRDDGSNTLFVEDAQATPAKRKAWQTAYTALKPSREQVARHVEAEKEGAPRH